MEFSTEKEIYQEIQVISLYSTCDSYNIEVQRPVKYFFVCRSKHWSRNAAKSNFSGDRKTFRSK